MTLQIACRHMTMRRLFTGDIAVPSHAEEKENHMFTLFVVLISFVLMVSFAMAAHGFLFKQTDAVGDPEWERYWQSYD